MPHVNQKACDGRTDFFVRPSRTSVTVRVLSEMPATMSDTLPNLFTENTF